MLTLGPWVERFWAKVDKTDGCWIWRGGRGPNGYGIFRPGGKPDSYGTTAHRIAHWLATGDWPEVVAHSCDVRACVNPAHLWSGSQADNMQDCIAKGRFRKRAVCWCGSPAHGLGLCNKHYKRARADARRP